MTSKVLEEFLRRSGFAADKAFRYAQSFSGRITARIAQPGETFLRYTSRPDSTGDFLTKSSFATPAEALKTLDLAARYVNNAEYVQRVVVSRPTLVFEGGIRDGARGVVQTLVTEEDGFIFRRGVPY